MIRLSVASALSILAIVSCTNSNNQIPTANNPNPLAETAITCDSSFSPVATSGMDSVVVSSTDKQSRTITLKSQAKYPGSFSQYNLSGNCFLSDGGCQSNEQLYFNNGGDAKDLGITGNFIVLDKTSSAQFDTITLENLNSLGLKTQDGTVISRDTIFGDPSTTRKLALGESHIYKEYDSGSVLLALVDDTWSNQNYQLFKMRVDKVTAGEQVNLVYQRIAEAPKDNLRNYYCSKQALVKGQGTAKASGDAIVYSRSYGSYEASTFGFDYGVNGFDGRFAKSERVMSFGDPVKCDDDATQMCVVPYVGWVTSYWGGVIDLANKEVPTIQRANWPNLQTVNPKSASQQLKANHTYGISQFTDHDFTFGAIRISEIDSQGRWVKFSWKRVAIEQPTAFMMFTQLDIPLPETSGTTTLESLWAVNSSLDPSTGKRVDVQPSQTNTLDFQPKLGTLSISNSYFKTNSGIFDVTGKFRDVDSITASTADQLEGQYQASAPIRPGHIYIVSSETLWYKVSLAVQVQAFDARTVTLKYKRLYNGQTFPGKWSH